MKRFMLLTALVCLTITAQTFTGRPARLDKTFDFDAQLIPTSATTITNADTWIELVTLTNETSSDVTCTIQDRQSPARALIGPAIPLKAKQHWIQEYKAYRKMKGGITWSCSSVNAVTGYIVGRQQ